MSSEWLSDCESSCGDYPVGIDDISGTGVNPWESSLRLSMFRNAANVCPHYQVIIGFVGGAFIAIVFSVLYYLLAYDPTIYDAAPINPVDDRVLRSMRGWARKRFPGLGSHLERNQKHLNEALGEASLPLSGIS